MLLEIEVKQTRKSEKYTRACNELKYLVEQGVHDYIKIGDSCMLNWLISDDRAALQAEGIKFQTLRASDRRVSVRLLGVDNDPMLLTKLRLSVPGVIRTKVDPPSWNHYNRERYMQDYLHCMTACLRSETATIDYEKFGTIAEPVN